MMTIILKHIVKNIYEKKLRTSLILVTILLSTIVLFIGLSLNDILNQTYSTMVNGAYGDANVLMRKTSDEENPLYHSKDIHTDSIVVDDRLDMIINTVGMSELNGESVRVSLTGLDLEKASEMNVVDTIDQTEGFQLNEKEAMISSRTASNYNLDIGDYLKVELNSDSYTYMIGAISKSTGLYYSEMDDIILVMSNDQLNEIYGTQNLVTSTLLKVDHEKLDKSIETLTNNHPSYYIEQVSELDSVMRDEETFQTTMIVAIIIIVMISAYVILSLSKVIVAERMPTIGTFRSVGTPKRMINRILQMEFLLYGIIGAVIGLLLALLLLPIAADQFNEYKEYGVETVVKYHPMYIVIALVFGSLFPIIIGMFHIYRANRQSLKEIILHTTHTVKEYSPIAIIFGIVLFISAMGIHFYNRQDQLLLALISVLCLFIAIVLLMPTFLNVISKFVSFLLSRTTKGEIKIGIKNIANNKLVSNNANMIIVVFLLLLMIGVTSAGIDQYISKSVQQDFDIFIGANEMDFSNFEDLETIAGVNDVYRQHIGGAQYDIQRAKDTFVVYGVEDLDEFDQFYSGATFFGDTKYNLNNLENGIIIDIYQAERYDLEIGDTFLMEPLDQELRPLPNRNLVEVEVAGVMDAASLSSNKDIVIVPLDFFQDHFIGSFNQIEVKVSEDVEVETVKNTIKNHYPYSGIQVQSFKELIESQKATVDTLIQGILMIILLGLVIGLLGITNNLLVSFMERKKEYAVLYSVCMSRTQLIKMLFYEMIMTFVSVVIIGFLGGLAMNMVWTRFIYAVGLKIDLSFNYELFLILCGAVFVLLACSSVFMIRKVARLNVLHELRYE